MSNNLKVNTYLYPFGNRTYVGTVELDLTEYVDFVNSVMTVHESDQEFGGSFELIGSVPIDNGVSPCDCASEQAIDLVVSGDPHMVALAWGIEF